MEEKRNANAQHEEWREMPVGGRDNVIDDFDMHNDMNEEQYAEFCEKATRELEDEDSHFVRDNDLICLMMQLYEHAFDGCTQHEACAQAMRVLDTVDLFSQQYRIPTDYRSQDKCKEAKACIENEMEGLLARMEEGMTYAEKCTRSIQLIKAIEDSDASLRAGDDKCWKMHSICRLNVAEEDAECYLLEKLHKCVCAAVMGSGVTMTTMTGHADELCALEGCEAVKRLVRLNGDERTFRAVAAMIAGIEIRKRRFYDFVLMREVAAQFCFRHELMKIKEALEKKRLTQAAAYELVELCIRAMRDTCLLSSWSGR